MNLRVNQEKEKEEEEVKQEKWGKEEKTILCFSLQCLYTLFAFAISQICRQFELLDAYQELTDNIKVYPNPVRPDYHGDITITGLPENADVRIVNTSGRTLYGGTSAGGTFTWDCRATDGGRVGAGVYYIMVATEDGKKGVAAKFVVI